MGGGERGSSDIMYATSHVSSGSTWPSLLGALRVVIQEIYAECVNSVCTVCTVCGFSHWNDWYGRLREAIPYLRSPALSMGKGEHDTYLFFTRTIGLQQQTTISGRNIYIYISQSWFSDTLVDCERLMAFHPSKGRSERKKMYWTSAYIANNISHKKFDRVKPIYL